MSQYTPRHLVDPSALTSAEITFLRELCAGPRDLREVAARLKISCGTACNRSRTICNKLGAANWREAVAMWREIAPMSTPFPPESRSIDDLLGEALYRYTNGAMRPLWADMPEESKNPWREKGRAIFDFSRAHIQAEKAAKERAKG